MSDDKLETIESTQSLDELEQAITNAQEKPQEDEVKQESVEEKTSATEALKEETEEKPKEEDQQTEENSEEQPESNIPEKYRGKSPEEIIRMHQEAEKAMHAKSQESASYRKLLADKVEFDEAGHIVGIKEPPKTQSKEAQNDYWSELERATNLPRQTLQPLMALFDMRLKQERSQFEQELQPLRMSQSQARYERLKSELKTKPEYKYLNDVEADMDEFIKERGISFDSIKDEKAIATLYYTALGKRYDKKVEKKKAETNKLKEVSEKEKTEAQVSTSTKAVTEGTKDINTMSLDELEKQLPKQEL
jgi:hypothetical protein